jgi:Na+-transporting NADH:ubiquinone oxidoreductase subunit NqrB
MPVVETDAPPAVDPATLSHSSQKDDVIASSVVCLVIAAVFVGLRFYTRSKISKSFGQSDWWLLAALVRVSLAFLIPGGFVTDG